MNILKTGFHPDFDRLLKRIEDKYGFEMLTMDGIGEQLNLSLFNRKFFRNKSATADISVDGNSNVSDRSVISYNNELIKPINRINSYYMLWKQLRKLEMYKMADEVIEDAISGKLYINDFHGYASSIPYCFNYSTLDIMINGIGGLVPNLNIEPPKHLTSFKSQLEQFIIIASNSTLGATGVADLLLTISIYMENILKTYSDAHYKFLSEDDCWNYLEEILTSMIYTFNQPMRASQSPFTNISIYDDYFLDEMLEHYINPKTMEKVDKELVKDVQAVFLTAMNKVINRTVVTFPVVTACFSLNEDREIQDEEFLGMISAQNNKYCYINLYGGSTSTLSSCCFSGNQKVLIKNKYGISLTSFKTIKDSGYPELTNNMTIFHNGNWVKGKLIEVPKRKMYKVTTMNNKEIIVTDNHINVTLDGNKFTNDLSTNDYLAFNTLPLQGGGELTYEQGVFIGAYLGDGSIYDKDRNELVFSLNNEKASKLLPLFKTAFNVDCKVYEQDHNSISVRYYNKDCIKFIRKYVVGNYSHEKGLDINVLNESIAFRQGIIDGYYATDGGNSNRIYTTSKRLCEDIETVLTSLGKCSVINISDRTNEPVVIRGESYKRNYPLYCIRFYETKNRRSYKDLYIYKNNTLYFKIKSIEEVSYDENNVYCFEMHNQDEPYFTLPNGMTVHNCRLRSDVQNDYFNSFGAGGSKIGSLGVVTINLPRVAYENNGDLLETLKSIGELTEKAFYINYTKRLLLRERIADGKHPLYSLGFIDEHKQYATLGFNGFNEAIELMGYNPLEFTGVNVGKHILSKMNHVNDELGKQYGVPVNLEQIPAENVSVKLAKKDRYLGFNEDYKLYSNQFIPLTTKADMIDRIKLQGEYDSYCSGGSILHINDSTEDTTLEQDMELTKYIFTQGVIYYARNKLLKVCRNKHVFTGRSKTCPICGETVESEWTRVVGFITQVDNWIKERREIDFTNREFYDSMEV